MNRTLLYAASALCGLFAMQGCTHDGNQQETTMIEFLYIQDCPNSPEMKKSLEAAVAESGRHFNIVDVDLMTLEPGDARLGYGAPTVLVNGVDLFGAKPSKATAGTCRVYPVNLPTSKEIASRISGILFP